MMRRARTVFISLAAAIAAGLPLGRAQVVAPTPGLGSSVPIPESNSVAIALPKATPAPVEYALPFSLSDCFTLLSTARNALRAQASGAAEYDMDSVVDLLETTTNYLRDRDSMHSSLADYNWTILASRAADSDVPKTETILLSPEADGLNIAALSFEVADADATIHTLEVYSDENELVGPFRQVVTLRHSLPRRYVFHLYRPTRVGRIALSTSKSRPGDPNVPRIVILAGRTDKPEPGKAAIHFIWRAQLALRAGEYDKADKRLERAQSEIMEYRRILRAE